MNTMASRITNLMIVYSIFYSGADEKIQDPCHRSLCGNSPPVTRKMFPFDDVIMTEPSWIDYTTRFIDLIIMCYVNQDIKKH